jgi:hypothetical protein
MQKPGQDYDKKISDSAGKIKKEIREFQLALRGDHQEKIIGMGRKRELAIRQEKMPAEGEEKTR